MLFLQKVSPRRDHSDADDVLIERDEPSPVELLRIKNQCVVFRVFARSAGASDGAGDLRKKGDLLVVAADVFWTGDTLVGEKRCLARAIEHYLGFDVLALAVRPANGYASQRAVIGQ